MGKDLKVIYMFNGLMYVGEKVDNDQQIQFKKVLAFAPGQKQGSMQLMPAFPFTDMDEAITLEHGSYIAITELDDKKVESTYMDAVTQISAQKSGLILP
jgi:hypothetical protein